MAQYNGDSLRFLINLYFVSFSFKKSGTLVDYEKELGTTPGNPSSRKLFKELILCKILVKHQEINNVKTYFINKDKLKDFIDEQEVIKKYRTILEESAIIIG